MSLLELKNKKILVTGVAGFIGSSLAERLLKENCLVYGIDNFNQFYSGKENNIKSLKSNNKFQLFTGDILDNRFLKECMNDIDMVCHLAAQPGVRFSLENPIITNRINSEGTLNVLQISKENNIEKIVNVSSSSVYGNPSYTPVDENHPLQPISIYGVSKLAAEKYCSIYSKLHDQDIVSVRYHTVYGPKGRPDMAIFKWIDSLYNDKIITIFGDGNQTRDMTFIDDIIDGTFRALITQNISGEVFNLASGRTVSMNYVLDILQKLTMKNAEIKYEDAKPDDVKDTHGDISKAKKILNYIPKTTIEEGFKLTVKWYKEKFNL